MLRWPAFAVAGLLCVSLISVPAAVEAQTTALVASPTLTWAGCANPELAYYGLQCATLAVPLDHDNPTGPKIRLALTRKGHTASYKGVLLTNPGGPGGSGLIFASLSDYVPGNVGASYDWIGFDPRGVGASTPSLHCNRNHFSYNRPNYVPRKPWIRRHWLRKSTQLLRCLRQHRGQACPAAAPDHARHCSGHGGHPAGPGGGEDQLLRLLLRHLPRSGLRDPVPDTGRPVRPRRRREPLPGLVRGEHRPGPCLRREHEGLLALSRVASRGLPSRQALAGDQEGLLPHAAPARPKAGGRQTAGARRAGRRDAQRWVLRLRLGRDGI